MPAGSFFPLGFDAPGARILPTFLSFSFNMCHSLFSFFSSFLFLLFLFPPDLRFEEECWAVERCSVIMIIPYIIHYYKYLTGAHYFPQSFSHSAEVRIVPTVLISLVLTLIPLSGYPRYSTNDIVVLPLGWGYPSVFPTKTWVLLNFYTQYQALIIGDGDSDKASLKNRGNTPTILVDLLAVSTLYHQIQLRLQQDWYLGLYRLQRRPPPDCQWKWALLQFSWRSTLHMR